LALIAIVGLVLCALAWIVLSPTSDDPVYKGKRLSKWLEGYQNQYLGSGSFGNTDSTVVNEAIRQFDTNAIPLLLKHMAATDSGLELWWLGVAQKFHVGHFTKAPAYIRNYEAWQGFEALGPRASNAVPELVRIVKADASHTSRMYAIDALGAIGPAAEPAISDLMPITTNGNSDHSYAVAYALGRIHAQPERVVPFLKGLLLDKNLGVQIGAAEALGRFGPEAKSAVSNLMQLARGPNDPRVKAMALGPIGKIDPANPELLAISLELLEDSDTDLRAAAIYALKELGPRASNAVPALTRTAQDTNDPVRFAAERALKAIDPEAAAKISNSSGKTNAQAGK
jgi:hypothetical protein